MRSGFKIIGIKLHEAYGVLKPGNYFQFYQDEIISKGLYNTSDITINICSIVGKNGSGKSTLLELFYRMVYIISFDCDFFGEDVPMLGNKKNDASAELIYEINSKRYSLKFKDSRVTYPPGFESGQFVEHFFYTIVLDYSQYGLNSEVLGQWITSLSHKNDAYKTPLVINPKRTHGNIDVNNERKLAQQRLLTNFLSEKKLFITEYKFIEQVDLTLKGSNEEQFLAVNQGNRTFNISYTKFSQDNNIDQIKNELNQVFFEEPGEIQSEHILAEQLIQYIIQKIAKICIKHQEFYQKYFSLEELQSSSWNERFDEEYFTTTGYEFKFLMSPDLESNSKPKTSLFTTFLVTLREDSSHVTTKLKQALLELKKLTFNFNEGTLKYSEEFQRKDPIFNWEIDFHRLPPAIFSINIHLKDEKSSTTSSFSDLSSGEVQQVFSIQSMLYHLRNIESAHNSNSLTRRKKYNFVNIIFDEVELYFHPDLQRTFIHNLLAGISSLNLKKVKDINIIFSTHSPFILSDIPNSNILRMDDGSAKPMKQNTFGANIHDLLANDFFMNDGFMGEFARDEIYSASEYLNNIINGNTNESSKWNKDKLQEFIPIIGEPILKYSLEEMFKIAFNNK